MTELEPLAARSIAVGLLTLPAGLEGYTAPVPIHVGPETQAYLEKLMAAVPPEKTGTARLIVDLKGIDVSVGAHLGQIGPCDIDGSAGVGMTWKGDRFAGAEVRVVWD